MTEESRRPKMLPGRDPGDRLEYFLAAYNLYQRCHLEQLFGEESRNQVSYLANFLTPVRVILWCPVCKDRRPFRRAEGQDPVDHYERMPRPGHTGESSDDGEAFYIYLLCAGCSITEFRCWIEAHTTTGSPAGSVGWLRKVGQVPQWNIVLSADLEEALGDDADLYKRAQICKTFSYGVGACAYLRRVLENRITPLLDTVYELRKADGASEEDLKKIQRIVDGKIAEEKIKLANEVLPDSIRVPGHNALYVIYDRLGNGIHARDEQQCIVLADWASQQLEYVVTQLSAARTQRRQRQAYEGGFKAFTEQPTP